jgi:2-keto-4-pentenoate hydratase/2-oxohepta-3-ene-1,7-dioic acid hydratase in catechol pathway
MRLAVGRMPDGLHLLALRAESFVDLSALDPSLPASVRGVLEGGSDRLAQLSRLISRAPPVARPPQRLAPPVPDPGKILCVGRNYAEHAEETGERPPTEPVIFSKLGSALLGHGAPIVLPHLSRQIDFEAELVVVIGRAGRQISPEGALEHVAGYTCGNDVTARDWQKGKPGAQWLLGKSFDTFAPLGPVFVSADEIDSPPDLAIEMRLNGRMMQQARTTDLIFPIDMLLAYVSQVATLMPGDLIFTGTPAGVGAARNPPVFLQPGDVADVEIERIGRLSNPVVSDRSR